MKPQENSSRHLVSIMVKSLYKVWCLLGDVRLFHLSATALLRVHFMTSQSRVSDVLWLGKIYGSFNGDFYGTFDNKRILTYGGGYL